MLEAIVITQIPPCIPLLGLALAALWRQRFGLAVGALAFVVAIGGGVLFLFALLLAAPPAEMIAYLLLANAILAVLGVVAVWWVLRRLRRAT